MPPKKRVLFLCTGNMCRSQMAEALLRHLAPDRFESLSAGFRPAPFVHPLAREVMEEIGIDMDGHRPKGVEEFLSPRAAPPDVVVTLCDNAGRKCPTFPGDTVRIHWSIHDPVLAEGNEELKRSVFRGVREEIRARIEEEIAGGGFRGGGGDHGATGRRSLIDRLAGACSAFLGRRKTPRPERPEGLSRPETGGVRS